MTTATDRELEILHALNSQYVRAVEKADTTWFSAHLADDFFNSNADGSIVDRNGFLAQIARGSSVSELLEHDVLIRIFDTHAVIHARTSYRKADGTTGAGRYTDDWHHIDGRWQCVSAHVTRA